MIWRFRIGKWRFTFTLAPVEDVVGVNSQLPDGRHVLMWDFDHTPLSTVCAELYRLMVKYQLPNIYIFKSSPGDNYIAYCLKRVSWWEAKRIVADTPFVDEQFFKYGVYRGYFTLRVSGKNGYTPERVTVISSDTPETASWWELNSWVVYETLKER
jgi:hypothetical protein